MKFLKNIPIIFLLILLVTPILFTSNILRIQAYPVGAVIHFNENWETGSINDTKWTDYDNVKVDTGSKLNGSYGLNMTSKVSGYAYLEADNYETNGLFNINITYLEYYFKPIIISYGTFGEKYLYDFQMSAWGFWNVELLFYQNFDSMDSNFTLSITNMTDNIPYYKSYLTSSTLNNTWTKIMFHYNHEVSGFFDLYLNDSKVIGFTNTNLTDPTSIAMNFMYFENRIQAGHPYSDEEQWMYLDDINAFEYIGTYPPIITTTTTTTSTTTTSSSIDHIAITLNQMLPAFALMPIAIFIVAITWALGKLNQSKRGGMD